MIIQVRGTSGSGKSTVMRRIMASAHWQSEYVIGRKRPLYYRSVESGMADTVILGHYESACGGCDTIGSAKAVYELTMELKGRYPIILEEGLLLSEDVKWSSQLPDLKVVYLTTPIEQCLSQIRSRRVEAGNDKPLNTENTIRRVPVIERSRKKLVELGVYCQRATVDLAVKRILDWVRSCRQSLSSAPTPLERLQH